MTDTLNPEQRSENMRRIRATHTSPEMTVRRRVHAMGYRFRLHVNTLPGRPDIVLPRLRKIIEVYGCFWHSHLGCKEAHLPKTRLDYWLPKLERNKQRDRDNRVKLKRLGWSALVVWECETEKAASLNRKLTRFLCP